MDKYKQQLRKIDNLIFFGLGFIAASVVAMGLILILL